ncbi:hypothetical protein IVB25_23850 [Bradyrhizobium sp. 193]|uniref:hypothetical protein n=1 Tax=Bradyrhizobium sp. 193 TaxID=2782661 RepID=UPI001FFAC91C|nr:hypothetical protein [Bradyrhizobium sp. 193]MCK1485641.1 hypothetical protein [Bradyrhizobium sp. 193]
MTVVVRAALLLIGVVGLLWSSLVMPSFWLSAPAHDVSDRIISDARFRPGVLGAMLVRLEAVRQPIIMHPVIAWAKTLVQLRAAEEAVRRERPDEADRQMANAEQMLRSTLSLNPAESFLWMLLYSAETARSGFDLQNVKYLNQSYLSGPNEGWIALRRSHLALSIFPLLSAVQQNQVVSEFARIVDADFIDQAALQLTTVGWLHRDRLLASLEQVDIESRQALSRQLSNDGFKFKIPGIDAEERPWR